MAKFKMWANYTKDLYDKEYQIMSENKIESPQMPLGFVQGPEFDNFSSMTYMDSELKNRKIYDEEKKQLIDTIDQNPAIKSAELIFTDHEELYLTRGTGAVVEKIQNVVNKFSDSGLTAMSLNLEDFLDWLEKKQSFKIKVYHLEDLPVLDDKMLASGKFTQIAGDSTLNVDFSKLSKVQVELSNPKVKVTFSSSGEFSVPDKKVSRVVSLVYEFLMSKEYFSK